MHGEAYRRELLNAADRQTDVIQSQQTRIEHAGAAPMLRVVTSDSFPLDVRAYSAAGWFTCGSSDRSP